MFVHRWRPVGTNTKPEWKWYPPLFVVSAFSRNFSFGLLFHLYFQQASDKVTTLEGKVQRLSRSCGQLNKVLVQMRAKEQVLKTSVAEEQQKATKLLCQNEVLRTEIDEYAQAKESWAAERTAVPFPLTCIHYSCQAYRLFVIFIVLCVGCNSRPT